MEQGKKQFEYRDVDYLETPSGWLEVILDNRLKEGFEIWRDPKNMSWRGNISSTGTSNERPIMEFFQFILIWAIACLIFLGTLFIGGWFMASLLF